MVHWPDVLMVTFKKINLEALSQLERDVDKAQSCLDTFDNNDHLVSSMFAKNDEFNFNDEIDRIFAQIWNGKSRI